MDRTLQRLLDLLDDDGADTIGTSIRLPVRLRDAVAVATQMGLASSTTELTVRGLRDVLEAFAQCAVLDAHYQQHPDTRPGLEEIALATAQLDASPLAQRPDLLKRAAAEVGTVKADPTPDDVLLYAAGLAAAVA
jgi:hypothetical protein